MKSAFELLNITSEFWFDHKEEKISFHGYLFKEDNNILLNAEFPCSVYKTVFNSEVPFIYGNINGTLITFQNVYLNSFSYSMGNVVGSVVLMPAEIIIGVHYTAVQNVKRMISSTEELNYMFLSSPPLKHSIPSQENGFAVLVYNKSAPITASDSYGKVSIYQTFGMTGGHGGYDFPITSKIEYEFSNSLSFSNALTRLFSVWRLLIFFADDFFPYGNIEITFENDDRSYPLWMNYADDVPSIQDHFIIIDSQIKDDFQKIWDNWTDIDNKANPISSLFIEIICNRSTRINSFLNLAQALEVYSSNYRKKEAKKVFQNDKNYKGKSVALKHRIEDILSYHKDILELNDNNISALSQNLADMRNYYTHYNKKYVEPTIQEVFSASYFLRFVLLSVVYTKIGLTKDIILESKKSAIFNRLENDINTILGYSNRKS